MSSLEITSEELELCQVQLTIVVPADRVESAMHESAQRIGRQLKIPGYRPGKVPVKAVIAQVGESEIKEDAMEQLTQQVVGEAIKSEDLHPIAPTSVELINEDPVTYRATVPLAPEIDLGDYLAIRVEPPGAEPVTDEQVDEVIEAWRRDMAFLAPAEREAEEGDVLTVSLTGRHGDDTVFDEDEFNLPLNAEGAQAANLPPEIIDHLVGMSAGESQQFDLTYSEFWPQSELQNEVVQFNADVAGVSAINLPDLDDSLAQEVGDVESLDELRERVRQQTEFRAQMESREEYVESALDALVEGSEITYPPGLLEAETAEVVADLRTRIERQGFTWERWLELQQTDLEKLWEDMEQQAEKRLKRGLVLNEFVRNENIEVTENEIEEEVDRLSDLLPKGTSKSALPSRDQVRQSTSSRMLTNRALERLVEIVSDNGAAFGTEPGGDDSPEPDSDSKEDTQ